MVLQIIASVQPPESKDLLPDKGENPDSNSKVLSKSIRRQKLWQIQKMVTKLSPLGSMPPRHRMYLS
jgi:hypothetical protein